MLRHSIRMRFTCILFAIIFVTLLVIGILNTFGLEMFYRLEKIKEIQSAYESIDLEVAKIREREGDISEGFRFEEEEESELKRILGEYSNRYNISIAIIDSLDNTVLLSSERDGEFILSRVQEGIFKKERGRDFEVMHQAKNYLISMHKDEKGEHRFIECIAYCSDDLTMVLMSTPVASLKASVNLSNRFLLYIGFCVFLITFVIIFFMTRKITQPILALADISEKICGLDFEAKYCGDYEDEIGKLGHNMNLMSQRLKQTIEELKTANEDLQEELKHRKKIDEMRTDFISNVSHELKTPIALIQGYAEGLNVGLCEDEDSRRYYTEVIMDEADKMNLMVKQLLTLSSLESGGMELQFESFDICEMISGVLASTSILLGEKKVHLLFSPDQAFYVRGDEFKIEEVLTNYISNAIHHVKEEGRIEIRAVQNGDKVRISVENTGGGIPEEDLKHIWEKFYKVDKAHSRSYGGSGIGLSIVKAIMEAHGEKYGVRNTSEGIEFYFELQGVKNENIKKN